METGQKRTQQNSNIKDSTLLILSIQVSLNGLSFSILDRNNEAILFLERLNFEKKLTPEAVLEQLKGAFQNHAQLQQDFDRVKLIHENELATVVPQSLFSEDHLADYLKFNSRILKTDYIAFDALENQNMVTVYVPYVNINNYVYEQFGEFDYLHYSSILISYVLKNTTTDNQQVIVHISETNFEILISNKGQLQFYNTFTYSTKEDFIYYLLFTLEQQQIDPDQALISFIGQIDEQSPLFEIAYTYIRHIEVLPFEIDFQCDKVEATSKDLILLNSF